MTIKVTKLFDVGNMVENSIDETEFPIYPEFVATLEAMMEKKCHTIIVTLDEGLQVLYTLTEKKP